MTNETTVTRTVVIPNDPGLHVRPAKAIAELVEELDAEIQIRTERMSPDESVNAESIMDLLTLGAREGEELVLSARGNRKEASIDELVAFIRDGCGVDYDNGN